MSLRQAQLDRIVDLSAVMQREARDDNWDRVDELMRQRQAQIDDVLATPIEANEADAVASALRRVMELDRGIMQSADEARKTLQDELSRLRSGRRALEGYFRT